MGKQDDARRVIKRISDLRDLALKLSRTGYLAGLHNNDPEHLLAQGPERIREERERWGGEGRG